MKNDLSAALNRELRTVRLTDGMKRSIMAAAVSGRVPAKKRISFAPIMAMAAALMVMVGGIAFLTGRPAQPDLSVTPLSAAGNQGGWVFVSDDDELYHWASACSGMTGSRRVRPEAARNEGRHACSECAFEGGAEAEKLVWMSGKAKFYHTKWDCSGLTGAEGLLEEEAKALGAKACGACFDGVVEEQETPAPDSTMAPFAVQLPESTWTPATPEPTENVQMAKPTPTPMMTASPMPVQAMVEPMVTVEPAATDELVWPGAAFYHKNSQCMGEIFTHQCLKSELNGEKWGCPVCCLNYDVDLDAAVEDGQVWIGDSHYHHSNTCGGKVFALALSEDKAVNIGLQACSECTDHACADVCLVSDGETVYHHKNNCSGGNHHRVCLTDDAERDGRTPCNACIPEKYWMNDGGKYYHTSEHCSGMNGAHSCREREATQAGKTACPSCLSQKAHHQEQAHHAEGIHHTEKKSSSSSSKSTHHEEKKHSSDKKHSGKH